MFFVVGLWGYFRFLLVIGFAFSVVQNVLAIRHGVPGLVDIVFYQAVILFLLLGGPRRIWALWRWARRHRTGAASAAALCILAASASAHADQPPPLHDKIFYMQHRAEREATLAWCHVSADRSRMYDCQNAEAAGNERIFTRPQPRDFLTDPSWWRANPIARDGVLRTCLNPTEADRPTLRYCHYAAMGL